MKQNSALFLKALVEQSIPYKTKNTSMGSTYTLDFALDQTVGKAHVSLFNDDNGVRIIINDFFHFAPDETDMVLDIINNAPERGYTSVYVEDCQVFLRKELTTGGGFSPDTVLNTLDDLSFVASRIFEKLSLIDKVLS